MAEGDVHLVLLAVKSVYFKIGHGHFLVHNAHQFLQSDRIKLLLAHFLTIRFYHHGSLADHKSFRSIPLNEFAFILNLPINDLICVFNGLAVIAEAPVPNSIEVEVEELDERQRVRLFDH